METVLHPCPKCGHDSMDECWATGQEFPARNRKLCVECHDECLVKSTRRSSRSGRAKRADKPVDPRLLF